MIQASLKILVLLAIMASVPSSGRLFADAPQGVIPASSDQEVQERLQQVGHRRASRIQQAQCDTGHCQSHSNNRSCETCQADACEPCGKRSLFDKVKSFFYRDECSEGPCGFNLDCHACRLLGHQCGNCQNHFLLPNGCGGKGCPPFGRYQMVYPLDPEYCDPRNRNVHAAQGYNMPVAVPLAPVVRHQYNYSWGVPASRLTPISNYVPRAPYGHGYPRQMPSNYCPSCQTRSN